MISGISSKFSRMTTILILVDALLLFFSAYMGIFVRFTGIPGSSAEPIYPKALSFVLVMGYVFYLADLYNYHKRHVVYRRIIYSFLLGLIPLSLLFYFIPELSIGRGWFLISYTLALFLILAWRWAAEPLIDRFRSHEKILIVGTGSSALDAMDLLKEEGQSIYDIEGFIAIRGNQQLVSPEKILDEDTNLSELAKSRNIDKVVIAADDRRRALPFSELLECKMAGIDVLDVPTLTEILKSKISLNIYPSSLIFTTGFKRTMMIKTLKTNIDKTLACLALVIASPLFLIIPIMIKLDSRGPVIFKQLRVGEYGNNFKIMKFRTMREDAEAGGASWTTTGDSRITRIGKFLRKSRLDELPQLINVLKGNMSFVGPRPEVPHFVDKLKEAIPYYAQRHVVKPGITGWAQIKYPYGASAEDAGEKLQYDLYYIKHFSISLDAFIIFETVRSVLTAKGSR